MVRRATQSPAHWYLRSLHDIKVRVNEPPFIQAASSKRMLYMLQVFYLDVAKVDLDVASICFKCSSGCNLGHVKSFGQLKYFRALLNKLPEDIEKFEHLETLDALEELSAINLGIQSVEFIKDWGHKKACISTVSRLFRHLRELRMWDSGPDVICSFMASCVPTPPPLQKLPLDTHNLNRVGPLISSLVNLSRLYIDVYGEAGNEGINILASLPMLLSLTVYLSNDKDGDSGILYPRQAINRQGFQLLVKFKLCCWRDEALEFEPGAMPKLQRLKLELMARCQFKFGEGGLVHGLQNLGQGLKHVAVEVDCEAAVADEVEALEDDIRGAAAVHPNRPILQSVTELKLVVPVAMWLLVLTLPRYICNSGGLVACTGCTCVNDRGK
ncbi:uncharacterized protein [Miscanthus floridulus]|uniref:uncharacterized protein n=1 Tax=Miscanthus floridulus TaxID=154761 RepID=UPI00345749F9